MADEAEWETAKENFVPVKQGRPTSALVTPVSVKKCDKELDAAKREFLADIAAAEDPLPAWLKYIKWTQEQYSTQASKAQLTDVLHAATKALSSTCRYHDDVRLLRIWVQYADCLPDPSDVFMYLQDQGIGHDHALLYEAYAAYLELKGSFAQAGLVYEEGIRRLAKPLERLKHKHTAFLQRMAKRKERQASEEALGMAPAVGTPDTAFPRSTLAPLVPHDPTPQLDENGRPLQAPRRQQQQQGLASVTLGVHAAPAAAGVISSSGSRGVRHAATPAGALWASVSGAAGSSSGAQQQRSKNLLLHSLGVPGGSSSGSSSSTASNAPLQLQVHVDEELGPAGQGVMPTAFPPSLQQHGQLPGLAVATKENSSQPAAWVGTRLKQQAVFAGSASSKIEVFEDEEEEDEQDNSSRAPAAAQASAGSQQKGDGSSRSLLAQPAIQADAVRARQPAGVAAASHGAAQLPPATATQGQEQQAHASARQGSAPSSSAERAVRQNSSTGGSSRHVVAAAGAGGTGPPTGYNEALLQGPGGEELSFEEVRATAWRAAWAESHQQQQQQQQQEEQQARLQTPLLHLEQPGSTAQGVENCSRAQQRPHLPSGARLPLEAAAAAAVVRPPRAPLHPRSLSSSDTSSADLQSPAAATAAGSSAPAGTDSKDCTGSRRQPLAAAVAAAPSAVADRGSDRATSSAPQVLGHGGTHSSNQQPASMAAPHGAGAAAGSASTTAGQVHDEGVTLNTRAAMDAMNGMFGGCDDTTTMHGFGRRAGMAGQRHAADAAAAGVTINTRAAFDAMNGMFGGDDTTTMHGFGRAAAEGRRLAAADAGGVTINTRAAFDAMNGMFGGDDTTTMHGFCGATAAGPSGIGIDPTVTVNTRAAFDYMNGVFAGGADITLGQTRPLAATRKSARKTSRLSMAAATAAAPGRGGSSAAQFSVYEDTELLGTSAQHPSTAAGKEELLGLYEDTEFVGDRVAAAAAHAPHSSTGQHSLSTGSGSGSGGLGLYEDTDFITRPVERGTAGSSRQSMAAAGAYGSGVGVYEDTEFLTQPAAADHRGVSSRANMGAAAGGSGGLGLYEDTEFITRPVGSPGAAAACSQPSGGGLGLYEDTEFITGPVRTAAAAAAAGSSRAATGRTTGLLSKLDRLSLANEALSRGQRSRGGEEGPQDGRAGAPAYCGPEPGSLGLYEDTEFLEADRPSAGPGSGSGGSVVVCADTGRLTGQLPAAQAGFGRQQEQQQQGYMGVAATSSSSCGARTTSELLKENVPTAAADAERQYGRAPLSAAAQGPMPVPAAAVGSRLSGSGSILQQPQHTQAHGAAGQSRLGPGSAPNSPGASRPGTAASTPSGRPPRTPGTPGVWALAADDFEVMESPAVGAGRPQQPLMAASPAGSQASPGYGARENLPLPDADGTLAQRQLQPRSLADRATRAAALQPLSSSRAELLGVVVDPNALCGEDVEGQQPPKPVARHSPGRALRSLRFGRDADAHASHDSALH